MSLPALLQYFCWLRYDFWMENWNDNQFLWPGVCPLQSESNSTWRFYGTSAIFKHILNNISLSVKLHSTTFHWISNMCCQILLWYGQSIEKGHFGLGIIHEKIATIRRYIAMTILLRIFFLQTKILSKLTFIDKHCCHKRGESSSQGVVT